MLSLRPTAIGAVLVVCLQLAAQRASAQDFEAALVVDAGLIATGSGYTYAPFSSDDVPPDSGVVFLPGPYGALQIDLTWRVARILRVGGFLRGAVQGVTSRFYEELEAQGAFVLGPTFRFEPKTLTEGLYGGASVGAAGVVRHGLGFAAGFDVGYRFPHDGRWLGIGGSLTTQWSFWGQDGDHGHYEYVQGSVVFSLNLRVPL